MVCILLEVLQNFLGVEHGDERGGGCWDDDDGGSRSCGKRRIDNED